MRRRGIAYVAIKDRIYAFFLFEIQCQLYILHMEKIKHNCVLMSDFNSNSHQVVSILNTNYCINCVLFLHFHLTIQNEIGQHKRGQANTCYK